MGRVDNFPNLGTLWPTLRNVTKVNARLMRGQLWKFLICNIHSLKTSSKDALAPAEPRLIGRPGLMALPLTMSNNCLSLLNWLMKSAKVKTAVFFLPKWHFLWSMMEKWMKMWILNYTKRGLWLLMMGCVKRLHYFNSYSTMGLIAGKIRARWSLQSTFFFQIITVTQNPDVHLPTLFPAALKEEVYFCSRSGASSSLEAAEAWGARRSGSSIWNDIGLHKCHCLIGLMKSNVCTALPSWGLFLHHGGGAASVSLYTVLYRNKMYCHIWRCLGVKVGVWL